MVSFKGCRIVFHKCVCHIQFGTSCWPRTGCVFSLCLRDVWKVAPASKSCTFCHLAQHDIIAPVRYAHEILLGVWIRSKPVMAASPEKICVWSSVMSQALIKTKEHLTLDSQCLLHCLVKFYFCSSCTLAWSRSWIFCMGAGWLHSEHGNMRKVLRFWIPYSENIPWRWNQHRLQWPKRIR